LAREHRVAIVGGDTNLAESLIVSVCVIGHAIHPPVRRSGARPGDDIYVTGTLGDSALGLKLLCQKSRLSARGNKAELLKRHRRPMPRLAVGALLARHRLAAAMIDISDGLVQDLAHICAASGIGAVIWEDYLPLSQAYRALAGNDGTRHALTGGEDYELLFCAKRQNRTRVEKLGARAGVSITRIGACVAGGKDIVVLDRFEKPIRITHRGHDHFKK
jgi:thiamine-monophosphate kinase